MAGVYWEVIPHELIITATEKAGCTSIAYALRGKPRRTAEDVRRRRTGPRVRLYLRHPLERFVSAWCYFTQNGKFPGAGMPRTPSLEQFTDMVLDKGYANPHWSPQLAQHEHFTEVYRFENIADTWPYEHTRELGRHNPGRLEKPPLTYRVADLERFYARDLAAWNNAER